MNEKNQIVVAVIGAGYWGPNLVRNFSAVENTCVKYVCDLSAERLGKIKKSFPFVEITQDYDLVLQDVEVDAVLIATPVSSHFPLAKKALESGKHVFVEKPMAQSVKQCSELVSMAEKKHLILGVDHTFLFTGSVQKMKELIHKNEIGHIFYFDSERINLGLIQTDVNVIWDLAPHDISIMNYLFDSAKPIAVFATGASYVSEKQIEMAHVTIYFDTGAVGHIHVSWLSPLKIRKILVGGNKKMLLYNDLEPSEKLKVYDKGVSIDYNELSPSKPLYRAGDVSIPKLNETEALFQEAKLFVEAIQGKSKFFVDGLAGLEVVKILEACDRSIAEERKIDLF